MTFWKGNRQKLKAIKHGKIQYETFFRLKKLMPGLRKWKFRKISRIIRNDVKHHQNMKTSWNRWFWISFNGKTDWKIKNPIISIINLSFLKNEFRKQFATKFHCLLIFLFLMVWSTLLIFGLMGPMMENPGKNWNIWYWVPNFKIEK